MRINAALDTVNHYGVLGDLVIEKVAMTSYDEHGRVGGTCLITEGHIVVAESGEMTSIAVNNKDTSKVDIETAGNGTVGVVFVATKDIAEEMDKPAKNGGVNDWFYNYTDAEGNPIELPENATDEQVTEYINTVIERINEIATSSVVYVKETNIYYDDIRDAVSAAINGQTIILVRDTFVEFKDSCYIRIDYGKELTFDLNGHMLTANTAVAGNTALIDNRGTLTIQDSTDKKCDGSGSGLLTNIATKADDKGVPGYARLLWHLTYVQH